MTLTPEPLASPDPVCPDGAVAHYYLRRPPEVGRLVADLSVLVLGSSGLS
jgi:hypothetical protein